MRAKYIRAFILLVFWISCLPMQSASADHGPKPTLDFAFTQEFSGPQVSIVSGTLLECKQADCSDAIPLTEIGPQGFRCEATNCHALAYGFREYHRLEIAFSDGKTRQSNIFKTAEFNAHYKVAIRENDLLVEPESTLGLYSVVGILILCCSSGLFLFVLLGLLIFIVAIIFIVRQIRQKQRRITFDHATR